MDISATILVSDRIELRPLEESDIGPDYLSWVNDPMVTKYLEVGTRPTSMADLHEYFSAFQNSQTNFIFAIIEKESGKHIGNVTLNNVNRRHLTADTGLMIGRQECWGKGYAFEAWSLVMEYAFRQLGLQKVIAGAVADNKASIATLKKLGFQVEGTLRREFFVEGEYRDIVRMGLLREEFYKLSKMPIPNGSS